MKLYDFCKTGGGVNDLLDTVARAFIRREEGEKRADNPYRDDVKDAEIDVNGYFLRRSSDHPNQIDVYLRKTEVIAGRVLWNTVNITCQKVMHFGVTEASLGLPIECTGKGITVRSFPSTRDCEFQSKHMEELKKELAKQRQKVELQLEDINDEIPELISLSDSDFDSESSEDYECPEAFLRRRIDAEWKTKIIDTGRLLRALDHSPVLDSPWLSIDENAERSRDPPPPPPPPSTPPHSPPPLPPIYFDDSRSSSPALYPPARSQSCSPALYPPRSRSFESLL